MGTPNYSADIDGIREKLCMLIYNRFTQNPPNALQAFVPAAAYWTIINLWAYLVAINLNCQARLNGKHGSVFWCVLWEGMCVEASV